MWELDCEEGWAQKNWCFWTVVLEKTLESPLDCREIQPVHSEGDNSGISLERMMLKLKLQHFGHLMWRADSLEKTLMLGEIGGRRWRGRPRMRWLDGITNSMDMSKWTPGDGDGQGGLACCNSWGRMQRVRHDWATDLNWTELPFLISNSLNLPFCTQGRPRKLKEAYFLQTRNGEQGKLLHPGPRGLAPFLWGYFTFQFVICVILVQCWQKISKMSVIWYNATFESLFGVLYHSTNL